MPDRFTAQRLSVGSGRLQSIARSVFEHWIFQCFMFNSGPQFLALGTVFLGLEIAFGTGFLVALGAARCDVHPAIAAQPMSKAITPHNKGRRERGRMVAIP